MVLPKDDPSALLGTIEPMFFPTESADFSCVLGFCLRATTTLPPVHADRVRVRLNDSSWFRGNTGAEMPTMTSA